jgi:hypothetical protein
VELRLKQKQEQEGIVNQAMREYVDEIEGLKR